MTAYVSPMHERSAAVLDRFITMEEMKGIMRGYSEEQIRRLEKDGTIPSRRFIGKRRTGWLASEIHEWMRNRPRVW